MTQNEKDLLLQDLCARLPYGIKFPITVKNPITSEPIETTGTISDINRYGIVSFVWDYEGQEILVKNSLHIKDVKPYLLPLSSMTERQCYKLSSIRSSFQDCWKYIKTPIPLSICNFEQIEWFHKNHLDYRGIIPMDLAIDATDKNIY
jgi:hypothetical protein